MTTDAEKRRNLGRGLSALLGDDNDDYASLDKLRASKQVPVELIRPSRFQPRRRFDATDMDSLVASIRAKGILQPILVRRDRDQADGYEIVAGERRWRAAQQANLYDVPVVIKELDDRDALEIALVENIQRQDLSPLEEAEGYHRLMEDFEHNQEELARVVGKSRSHIANTLRLLGLPDPVKRLLDDGKLTAGHARALLNSPDPEALARRVVARGLNVRQTERLAQQEKDPTPRPSIDAGKDADTRALERELSVALGLKVVITPRGTAGNLVIRYQNLEQLDDVLQRLTQRQP